MVNHIASVVINRPVNQVYTFMSDPKNRLVYDPELIQVRQSPEGPLHIGTKIVEVRSMLGIKGEMVTEVSELESNQLIGYRTLKGDPMTAYGAYQFDAVSEGTRLTLNFTLDPQGIAKLITPLIAGNLKRSISAGLASIKTVLESR